MPKNNLDYRVTQLEKDICGVGENVTKILTNHLPHLQNEITELRGEVKSLSDKVVVGVGINVLLIASTILGVVLLLK